MKKIFRKIRETFNEIFGWNCPECKGKRSVFFYDRDHIKDHAGSRWVDLYKCKECGIEGYKD